MKRFLQQILLGGILLVTGITAHAALTIEITQGVRKAQPIAVVPFGMEVAVPPAENVAAIVGDDLKRSGRFALVPQKDFISRPHQASEVKFSDWRLLNVPNLVVGKIKQTATGGYDVQFQLLDVFKGSQIEGYVLRNISASHMRAVAHQISDMIYERLTGEKGAFSTRILYVEVRTKPDKSKLHTLVVADIDGHNPQVVLSSSEPIMSPAWSPDGQRIAYVSYEKGRPEIYVQEIVSGQRRVLSSEKGINGAPAWSPDGKKIAMTLSFAGNPDVYVLDLASNSRTRITDNYAIDTEPAWSPDGKSLVFTSDRGGKPHIYRYTFADKQVTRLTFEGEYNARASFSPDGKRLTMVNGDKSRFRIAILDLKSGNMQVLTDSRLDESPSFAPNGSMVIYATEDRNRGVLAAVSVDGGVKQRLAIQEGDVREPAWGPFMNQ
ncbi:MAG: Tol-Pal system beta propeller repeat protein TolB [Pseudomonadota bacterium]